MKIPYYYPIFPGILLAVIGFYLQNSDLAGISVGFNLCFFVNLYNEICNKDLKRVDEQ